MSFPEPFSDHEAQLRELALQLVGDHHLADDVVQETYLAALRATDRDRAARNAEANGRTPGGRLRELLRVKARTARAREQRLRERSAELRLEHAGSAPSGAESSGSEPRGGAGEHAVLLNALAEELGRLDEPYASTLRLRFLEELPPRTIAARAGVPVRTVYTRVARGLDRLRERMDRRFGVGALLVLAVPGRTRAPRVGGRALRTAAVGATAAAALVAVLAWSALEGNGGPALAVAPAPDAPSRALPDALARPRGEADVPRAPAAEAQVPAPAPSAEPGVYRGRVVDVAGYPIPEVDVFLQVGRIVSRRDFMSDFSFVVDEPFVAHAESDADGTFVLRDPEQREGRVVAQGAGFEPVIAELVPPPGGPKELVLPAAPARTLAGRVTDEAGAPVEAAWVKLHPPPAYVASMTRRERTWMPVTPSAITDATGRFELQDAYDVEGTRLEVLHRELAALELVLGPGDRRDLELVLAPRGDALPPIRGVVLDEGGGPLAGAFVVAGDASTKSDDTGRFELRPGALAEDDTLWAVAPERLPATLSLPAGEDEVVLRVTQPELAIEGRVVDPSGAPLAGAYVWLVDPTHMGHPRSTWFAELYVNPSRAWTMPYAVGSAADGTFRIPHLLAREYRIGALWIPSWVSVVSEPIPAGTRDARLTLDLQVPLAKVAGHVVGRDGAPLAGVRVTVVLDAVEVEFEPGRTFLSSLSGRHAITDADGRFELGELPPGVRLELIGDAILRTRRDVLAERGEPGDLRVVVPRRAPLEVRAPAELGAERFALVDGQGRKLEVYDAARYDSSFDLGAVLELPLVDGRSEVAIAPDTATELLLLRGDEVLRRVPVTLVAGEPNVVVPDLR